MGIGSGRPANHKPYLSATEKDAAYRCLLMLRRQHGLSDSEIVLELSALYNSEEFEISAQDGRCRGLKEEDFQPDSSTIGRVFSREGFTNSALVKAFYLLFSIKYPQMWAENHRDADLRLNEPFVRAAHILLGYNEVINVPVAKALNGRYKLYRPFHLDPREQISVCSFVVGSADSIYDCAFVTEFDYEGRHCRHISQGKIVPHGQDRGRLTAITSGREETARSSFMFHFDEIEIEDVALALGGSLVASWGTHQSSAWPVYAVRLEDGEEFTPHVISKYQFAKLPKAARFRLNCGAVYWEEPFPRPFSGV